MGEYVILVDDNDKELGLEEKMKAHEDGGKLHRSMSVFVFNKKGELMIQQRAADKYHAGTLWAPTCCGHPRRGETPLEAGHRRLFEEMGFDCDMKETFTFKYETPVGDGMTEKEYDHMLFGSYEGKPSINMTEVQDWKWMDLHKLRDEIKKKPEDFAPWLILMIDEVVRHYDKAKNGNAT